MHKLVLELHVIC